MTKKDSSCWALIAVLIVVALTAFSVEAILDSEGSTNRIELTASEITGNAIEDLPDESDGGLNGALTKTANWIMDE